MVTLNALLHVGASGMRAAQLGVNVASQNVTNANTPGYSRRSVRQSPLEGPPEGGGGVRTQGPMRAQDRFLERRLLGTIGGQAEAEARSQALGVLDVVLSEDLGLGNALDAFQASLHDLSAAPADLERRRNVLARGDDLAQRFQTTARELDRQRGELNLQVGDTVAGINTLAAQIDRIQFAMKKAELTGEEASDLRDQRDQAIRDLGELAQVSVIDGPSGTVSVLLEGRFGLVAAEGGVNTLATTNDPTTGDVRVTDGTSDITSVIQGGKLGGLLAARDGALTTAESDLDQLAFDLAGAYNAVHTAGFGLDATSGRNLFSTSATASGAALSFAVSSDVAGLPDRLAAATDATAVAGDNTNALALLGLADATLGATSRTASERLSDLVSSAGISVATAKQDEEVRGAANDQVRALRESVSGVNSDDEMVSLMQYQRAYQASMRVVQVADELLSELVNLKR